MEKKIIGVLAILIFLVVLFSACFMVYRIFTREPELPAQPEIVQNQPIEEEPKKEELDLYSPLFTKENFPKMDASLATQPLTDAFYINFLGLTPADDAYDEYTNTHWGYERLITGHTTFKSGEYDDRDIIVVTYPSEEEQQLAKDNNIELDITPVVNEGFVFFVNKDNPVNNLTKKQIQDIYSGKITNWKEVGGLDEKIVPYQRPVNSGSQTGMLDLVMKDESGDPIPMIEPTKETFEQTMEGIIEAVADYDNSRQALGYSYYYYANTMFTKDSIKLISVDGVEPNNETIKNETYPIHTAYYIVTRKDEPKDSQVTKLKEAMLSERGQIVAENAGYVPVK